MTNRNNKALQRALVLLEGKTFEDSKDMLEYLNRINKRISTLQSSDWIEILSFAQGCLMSGFEVENRRDSKEEQLWLNI